LLYENEYLRRLSDQWISATPHFRQDVDHPLCPSHEHGGTPPPTLLPVFRSTVIDCFLGKKLRELLMEIIDSMCWKNKKSSNDTPPRHMLTSPFTASAHIRHKIEVG